MIKGLAIAAAVVLGCAAPALAAPWAVQRATGEVTITAPGAQTISIKSRTELPNGATVRTGKTGRMLLVRGTETMTVGPSAVLTVPGDNIFGFTKVLQKAGQVEFEVDTRGSVHFAVQTAYLAALVKGTKFVVRVKATGADVTVSRGRVGVTDNATGRSIDILPGQTATTSRAHPGLTLSGKIDRAVMSADQGTSAAGTTGGAGAATSTNQSGNSGSGSGGTSGGSNSASGGGNSGPGGGGGNNGGGGGNSGPGGGGGNSGPGGGGGGGGNSGPGGGGGGGGGKGKG